MTSIERFENSIVERLVLLGPAFFTKKNYRFMHSRALGLMAKTAIESRLDIAIDMAHLLEIPYQGKKQRQLQGRPDLTLFHQASDQIWGIVEYESIDINDHRLPYKRHLLKNWPSGKSGWEAVVVAMTVSDKPVRKDTPGRDVLLEHRDILRKETVGIPVTFSFILIDSKIGIEATRFKDGSVINQTKQNW